MLVDEHKDSIFVPALQGHRVLVADDDANTAFSVSSMLEEIGINDNITKPIDVAMMTATVAKYL